MFPLVIFFPSGRLLVSRHERLFVSLTCLTYKSIKRHSSSRLIVEQQNQQEQQEQQEQQDQQEKQNQQER